VADEEPRVSEGDRYLWWRAGAEAETRERDKDMSLAAREIRDVLEGFARLNPAQSQRDFALTLARIYAPEILKRRHRR
jgi:hypothetical protein